jgi:hypothetical protein
VLLKPKKGTQGREMNRKIRIASTLALAGVLLVSMPAVASAISPLLSGYGAPGTGEQAIIGSTLLGGRHGGTGSGGAGLGGSGGTLSGGGNSTSTGPGGGRAESGGSISARSGAGSGGASQAGAQAGRAGTSAFVYPSSLRSASVSSPALGISGGDLVLLAGIIATLALVGTLTIRLVRLQP